MQICSETQKKLKTRSIKPKTQLVEHKTVQETKI